MSTTISHSARNRIERRVAGEAAHARIVFGVRDQPRTSKPSPASPAAAGTAELAQPEHADRDRRERARMDVLPLAPPLRALELGMSRA